jgi:hypothetical protein
MRAVHPEPTTRENLLAFRITGKVTKEDMHHMAEMANAAFDRFETVDMLLIFDNFDGEETGALFDLEGIKAQFRAILNVGRYVVVGAPESARALIEGMGAILPLKAMTFDKGEEELAWVELEARPATATGTGTGTATPGPL